MTVYRVIDIHEYTGLAADLKPQYIVDTTRLIPAGSLFYELDTNKTYVWSSTGWVFFSVFVTTS